MQPPERAEEAAPKHGGLGEIVGDVDLSVLGGHAEAERHVDVRVEPMGDRYRERNVGNEGVVADVDVRAVPAERHLAAGRERPVRLTLDDSSKVSEEAGNELARAKIHGQVERP